MSESASRTAQILEAATLTWGDVTAYYPDAAEAERKRHDWDISAETWAYCRDQAISYHRQGDARLVGCALAASREIEVTWGDAPATDRLATLLGQRRVSDGQYAPIDE